MRILSTLCLALALAAPAAAAPRADGAQTDAGTQTEDGGGGLLERARERLRAREAEAGAPVEVLGVDGKPLLPGVLPAGAPEASVALWKQVLETSGAKQPIRAFDLKFLLRQRAAGAPQSNDLDLRFTFLAPDFVRAELESGRTLVRGPEGDWLIEGKEQVRLVGREGLEDKKQLDQMASLARNFVGLANPSHLRIYELGPGEAPRNLPPRVQPELSGLVWLRVVSPDFFLLVDGPPQQGAPALYAATLGVHSETHTIRFALLQERRVRLDDAGNEVPFLEPRGATLVRLDQYLARDGFLVPHSVRLFTQDPANPEPRFLPKPTSELTLTQRFGSLRSKLVPADFLP